MVIHIQASSGPMQDEHFSEEYFFADALPPGEVDMRDFPEQRFGATVISGKPIEYRKDPHPAAQVVVEFVQFSDGTIWGDVDSAQSALYVRKRTLAELDLLEHLYEQKGENAFLDELARSDDSLDVLRQLKTICDSKDGSAICAQNAVHRTLMVAKEHVAATGSRLAGKNE